MELLGAEDEVTVEAGAMEPDRVEVRTTTLVCRFVESAPVGVWVMTDV